MIEMLVANGHRFDDVLGYSLAQAQIFHVAIMERKRFEAVESVNLHRMGAIGANMESKDFIAMTKRLENGH